jgi:hypothetical protein
MGGGGGGRDLRKSVHDAAPLLPSEVIKRLMPSLPPTITITKPPKPGEKGEGPPITPLPPEIKPERLKIPGPLELPGLIKLRIVITHPRDGDQVSKNIIVKAKTEVNIDIDVIVSFFLDRLKIGMGTMGKRSQNGKWVETFWTFDWKTIKKIRDGQRLLKARAEVKLGVAAEHVIGITIDKTPLPPTIH